MFAERVPPVVSWQERTALLERVASSQHFKRASRLREFLLYVGQSSIETGGATIHEQEVGITVFGRQPGYDTSLDNIVRVNATELRKRLELYFVTEGSEEPVIIEIPRGSYTTIFRPRAFTNESPAEQEVPLAEEAVAVPAADEVQVIEPRAPNISAPRTSYLPWIFSLFLLGACVYFSWQNARLERVISPWKSNPALRVFWSRFFDSGQPTDVVVADTSFAVAEDIASRTISLGDDLSYGYKRLAEDPALSPDRRADLGLVLERNNGSVGDFIVAKRTYDDFLVGEMAGWLGHTQDAAMFAKRAQNYHKVLDPQTGFVRGRHQDGRWDSPFDPAVKYSYITEGLPYQYTFFVLQDIPGLIEAVHGREAFVKKLDGLFAGGYYD
jgi:Putative alpha-1,2-mannosidase